jgi:lipoate-protein ligase A
MPGATEGGTLGEDGDVRVDLDISCAENIREDERLLRAGLTTARVGVLADQAITVGVEVRLSTSYLARARASGLTVERRTSGGTAILHAQGDIAWSLVLPRGDPRVGRDYARAYGRLGSGVVRFLHERGVSAEWTTSPGLSAAYCLLGPRGSVLSVGERILGGAAQHLTGRALLHHGILPRTLDRSLLARIFNLTEARGLGRLTSLTELGQLEPAEVQAHRLAKVLARELSRT